MTPVEFIKNRYVKLALKITIVIVLLIWLAQKGFLSIEETKKALVQWNYTVPAFLLMTFNTFFGIYRWQILLRSQNINITSSRVVQLGFIGNFFNVALPGAVSGDLIKAIYVGREAEGARARALGSILFDRVVGVSALVLVSTAGMLLSLNSGWSHTVFTKIQLMVGAAGAGVVAFYGYLFVVRENADPLLLLFKALEARFPKAGSLTRTYIGVRHYHNYKGTVLFCLLLSVIIHAIVVFSFICYTRAVGAFDVPVLGLFVVVPLGLLVTAVPILPGGVGTGHAAFVFFLGLFATPRGADIFNLYLIFIFFQGAIGGLIYLRFKSKEHLPMLDSLSKST